MKTIVLTTIALIAFAGNSILCRLAIGDGNGARAIDAASFTSIRLLSGALVIALLYQVLHKKREHFDGKKMVSQGFSNTLIGICLPAFCLFVYAVSFSYAYISLDTGTGALILFAFVQITMIINGFIKGVKMSLLDWFGVGLAFLGLVYLLSPSVSAPSMSGFILMAISGVAWGIYTVLGKGSVSPLENTAANFIRTIPFVIILILFTFKQAELSVNGVVLALLSGGITSAVGYAIWYAALKGLSNILAASVQLLVPVIAMVGGVVFANEELSFRLIVSSVIILGGISLVILSLQKRRD